MDGSAATRCPRWWQPAIARPPSRSPASWMGHRTVHRSSNWSATIAMAGTLRRRGLPRNSGSPSTATRGGRDPFGAAAAAAAIETRHDLGALAKRVRPLATWHDLVVPADVLAALHDIAGQVRARATVYEAWGFGPEGARGLGISAMF